MQTPKLSKMEKSYRRIFPVSDQSREVNRWCRFRTVNWIIVLSRKREVHCLGGPIPIPVEIYVNDSRPSEKS